VIDPETGAEEWSTLLVAGKRSPGVVTLSGPGLEIGWDVKNAQGQGGATSDLTDEPLKKFTGTFQLSNEDDGFGISDFDRWDEFQELLESSSREGVGAGGLSPGPRARAHHRHVAREDRATASTEKAAGRSPSTSSSSSPRSRRRSAAPSR
jgi:hypothetical protein